MSPQAALAYARKMSQHNQVLAEELLDLRRDIAGALQIASWLVQEFGTENVITIPKSELSVIGGGVRVKENDDDTVTLIAVTDEMIRQAGLEMAQNGQCTVDAPAEVDGGSVRADSEERQPGI